MFYLAKGQRKAAEIEGEEVEEKKKNQDGSVRGTREVQRFCFWEDMTDL